jgi:hypothetical protein
VRDSHGLFDYENSQVKTSTILMNQSGSLYRRNHHVKFMPEGSGPFFKDSSSQFNEASEENESVELGNFSNANSKYNYYLDKLKFTKKIKN